MTTGYWLVYFQGVASGILVITIVEALYTIWRK